MTKKDYTPSPFAESWRPIVKELHYELDGEYIKIKRGEIDPNEYMVMYKKGEGVVEILKRGMDKEEAKEFMKEWIKNHPRGLK